MVFFFQSSASVLAVSVDGSLTEEDVEKLEWLFSGAKRADAAAMSSRQAYVGPRREMVTPWSTNAVEITQNMGLKGVVRIEEFFPVADSAKAAFDPMLQERYQGLTQDVFAVNRAPDPIQHIDNIAQYNAREGLALSPDEVDYLNALSKKLNRKLTDS